MKPEALTIKTEGGYGGEKAQVEISPKERRFLLQKEFGESTGDSACPQNQTGR